MNGEKTNINGANKDSPDMTKRVACVAKYFSMERALPETLISALFRTLPILRRDTLREILSSFPQSSIRKVAENFHGLFTLAMKMLLKSSTARPFP